MTQILLVEDEINFGAVLQDYLVMNDFAVTLCRDGEAGLKAFQSQSFDLLIFDVMMPKMDGFTLARHVREINSDIPIIFLTARSMKEDVLSGFEVGADDYITKPFESKELLYRVKAIMKRVDAARSVPAPDEVDPIDEFSFRAFHFNHRLHTLDDGQEQHRLSPKEADLLRLLLLKKNDLLSREEALQTLWGDDNYFNARSMDVFISKLRKRFKPDEAIKIENVHGKGFRMVIPDQ